MHYVIGDIFDRGSDKADPVGVYFLSEQAHIVNYPTFIFHMILPTTIWTCLLSDSIKAATTVWTSYRSNGKSGWFHDGYISAYFYINTVSGFMDFPLGFTIINPPCT